MLLKVKHFRTKVKRNISVAIKESGIEVEELSDSTAWKDKGTFITVRAREKLRVANRGEAKCLSSGKKHNPESKEKMRCAHKGMKKPWMAERNKKLGYSDQKTES